MRRSEKIDHHQDWNLSPFREKSLGLVATALRRPSRRKALKHNLYTKIFCKLFKFPNINKWSGVLQLPAKTGAAPKGQHPRLSREAGAASPFLDIWTDHRCSR